MSDELPDDIRALIDADRRATEVIPDETRKRIVRNVGAAVLAGSAVSVATLATAKAAASTGALAVLGEILSRKVSIAATAFFLGGAAGAGGYVVATKVVKVKQPAPICPSVVATAPTSPARPPTFAPAKPMEPAPSASVAPSVAPPAPAPSPSNVLLHESQIVSTATAALARGDHQNALSACDLRAKEFPKGQLGEECESVAIRALVGLGRDADARARADRFRARYPQSLYLPSIEATLPP
ncbi:MAG: hypothetical protein ACXWP4_14970 [Polyangiales bacterium]